MKRYGPSNIVLLDSQVDDNGCKGLTDQAHGSVVDQEMQQYVISQGNRSLFRELVPDPDPCTTALITEIESRGWILRASQFGIFDEAIGVATAIDLLAETPSGELVLLEQKVTKHRYCSYYEEERGTFHGPLEGVPFSLLNVDMLQLMGMDLMLYYGYGIRVDHAYLVRVGQGTIWLYRYGDWCATRGDLLYESLKSRSRVRHSINRFIALHRPRGPRRKKTK